MGWKNKFQGGLVGFIGFMLSPLSWWNDAFVNLPLAVGFGWLIRQLWEPAFETGVIVGYWLTNLLGFLLMHHGIRTALEKEDRTAIKREVKKDILISLAYTLLILLLLRLKMLQPITDYLSQ